MNITGIIDSEASLTDIVLKAMQKTPNPRMRQIMEAVVIHAHALVRELDLTEEEFNTALQFITQIGQATNDSHNEVVLAADVLGISTLVALRNNPQQHGQTAAALLGPFWRTNAPECNNGDCISRSNTPGKPMYVSGQVRGVDGHVVADALIDVWQASPVGLYENQDPHQEEMNLRGRFRTDSEGRYHFFTVRPAGYPVPTSGPVGVLLDKQHRHPFRPAHIHFMVSAPGFKTLITQVFADDSEYLGSDVVFGVTKDLVGRFEQCAGNQAFPGNRKNAEYALDYDFVLEPGMPCFPTPPIK
ncbi:dioxygenase [Undibacterium sp.]|jgi:protocatechuate 3,4-dioxygenase beta subunit|uniref:dioxygenase family protein n=1 Tax=Undibacterium sp. TaxID=1914977 RepID=UPI002CF14CC0|nr:dioxygenase [Undibacterium sp.]HTD04866.1 dioxygenase [Undibacterium sp.]